MSEPQPLFLTSGAYSAQSVIANCQRCVNLYPEQNPQETKSPVPVTHYLAPGLNRVLTFPDNAQVRGLYQATTGACYAVCGQSVYFVPAPAYGVWSYQLLGSLTKLTTQVKFADNGTTVLLVDGSGNGYQIDLATNVMSQVSAATNSGTNGYLFNGGNWVDFSDTFIVGNEPGTPRWWATASDAIQFDPLSFATKSGLKDPIQAVVICQRYVLLIGTLATEWWYNAGGTNFPYGLMNGPYVELGACAQYGVVKAQESVMFLSKDRNGRGMFLRIEGFRARKQSTFALESEWQTYPTISDVVGFSFQLDGHTMVGLRFPTADKTWVYDMQTAQWHERTTLDSDGLPHQWRVNCAAEFYGVVVGGDYQNGFLYEIGKEFTTDNGTPIQRIRGFPHINVALLRTRHNYVTADLAVGAPLVPPLQAIPLGFDSTPVAEWGIDPSGTEPLLPDPPTFLPADLVDPVINLRYSTTRGASWSTTLPCTFGLDGEYDKIVQWRRLSMARDMVFEFSWITPQVTALNGAFIGPVPGIS